MTERTWPPDVDEEDVVRDKGESLDNKSSLGRDVEDELTIEQRLQHIDELLGLAPTPSVETEFEPPDTTDDDEEDSDADGR
ncbi:MAG TPA: hypothetical protein VFA08_01175 [Actinomycetota bacterium]|nr:hypothetical protein [Actinomycetota bacterium]